MLALNLWAIPRWGGLGAAVSTLVCEVMLLLASSVMLRRAFGPLLSIQAASACAGATIVGLVVLVGLRDMGIVASTVAALLGYGVALWCFRVATAADVLQAGRTIS